MLSTKKLLLIVLCLGVSFTTFSQEKKVTVAQDGSGDYKTVQAAFDAVSAKNKKQVIIYIKNGVYKEKLHLDSGKNFVKVIGQDKFKTILTYNDHTGKISTTGQVINTRTSASCVIKANDFTVENITLQNDAGFTAGQAVGLEVQGDRAIIKNCRIIGNQDILFTSHDKSRQYYEDCYIEGTTDFIFGSSTAWFEKCHIHSKKNSHVTAASTPRENPYGYVFNECVLTSDSSLRNVSLGRPWQPYSSVTYLHCYIDKHIIPAGWDNWKKPENEKTARYSEYESFGPGANKADRAKWSRQLSEAEAGGIIKEKVLGSWIIRR